MKSERNAHTKYNGIVKIKPKNKEQRNIQIFSFVEINNFFSLIIWHKIVTKRNKIKTDNIILVKLCSK